MGFFDGIEKAQVSQGGKFFEPGRYKVRIKKVCMVQSKKDANTYFCIEAEILESNNADVMVDSSVSQLIKMGQVMSLPNIKGFLGAAQGIDPSDTRRLDAEIDGDAAELAVSAENPLDGLVLGVEAVTVKTRAGNDFTKVTWRPTAETMEFWADPSDDE